MFARFTNAITIKTVNKNSFCFFCTQILKINYAVLLKCKKIIFGMSLAQQVFQTLQTDSEFRQAEKLTEKADLFVFEDLRATNRIKWDNSLPTIHNYWKKDIDTRETLTSFKTAFKEDFPELNEVDFENVLVAGGSIGHYLTRKSVYEGDIDIFIHGNLSKVQATEKASNLIKQLIKSYKKYRAIEKEKLKVLEIQLDKPGRMNQYNRAQRERRMERDDFGVRLLRNENGISLYLGNDRKYQIIFRIYKNVTEILHGFDLGSSAVGYDGKQVYFTSLSLLSYR